MITIPPAFIIALAPPHEPRSVAPATFPDLMNARNNLLLPVWSGASDQTIWDDPRINFAARAWHDACHLTGRYPFMLAGERAACRLQIAQFYYAYPSAPIDVAALLWADVVSLAEHYDAQHSFPEDQVTFVRKNVAQMVPSMNAHYTRLVRECLTILE